MPRVSFTPHLKKHVDCEPAEVTGQTVAQALEAVFAQVPNLRGYVLDDAGAVRKHVMIFVDNSPIADRQRLSDRLNPTSEVFVMQALSGG